MANEFKVKKGLIVTGSVLATNDITASAFTLEGSGQNLLLDDGTTAATSSIQTLLPTGTVSGSSQINYPDISNIPSGIVSGSSQLTTEFDTRYLNTGGDNVVSGSSQIDHNTTTNYDSNEHIDHTSVSISSGLGLTGGGDITTSRTLTLDTGSSHFQDGVGAANPLPSGVVSGSAQVDHDQTTNFVSNEHIDHSTVTITAGSGLTGGGTIASSRTINIGSGDGISVGADSISVDATVLRTGGDGVISGSVQVDHDQTTNFNSDEHIGHSGVTITAGSGLTGGGDITTSRTINVGSGDGISVAADSIAVDGTVLRTTGFGVVSGSEQITHDNTTGFVGNEHIDHTTVDITAGSGLTGGGDISTSRTINVGAGDGISVGTDTISVDATVLRTTGDGVVSGSAQISYTGITDVPSGIVSGSTYSSPSQGTLRATINGADSDIDLGLQTGDSPTFDNLTVSGDLSVLGTTTTINTDTLTVEDNIIELNFGGAATNGGILVGDSTGGSTTSGSLQWDGTNDYWIAGQEGSETKVLLAGGDSVVSGSSQITHDSTTGFVGNEHIDHTTVDITAGSGLTGGGDISTSRTINVGAGDGISVGADSIAVDSTVLRTGGDSVVSGSSQINHDSTTGFVGNEHIDHTTVSISAGDGISGGGTIASTRTITLDTGSQHFIDGVSGIAPELPSGTVSGSSQIDHNTTTNYDSNEHIDHTTVSISAGSGLTGGGDISTNRTINVGAGDGITVGTDDISVDGTVLRTTGFGIVSGSSQISHDSTTGFVSDEHIDHSGVSITAGSGLTGGGDITTSRTINVGAGDGITVAADTVAVDSTVLRTTGDGVVSGSAQISYTGITDVPSGIVSGSSQIDLTQTTNYVSGIKDRLDAEQVVSGSGYLQNVVEDTTPQLGGNLDLNGNNISGSGNIEISGFISANYLAAIDGVYGNSFYSPSGGNIGDGPLRLGYDDGQSGRRFEYRVTNSELIVRLQDVAATTTSGTYTPLMSLSEQGLLTLLSGSVSASSYIVGGNTGGQNLLLDDGNTVATSSFTGISNVVEDTTPQLGGNLDLNSNNITGTGTIDITGTISSDSDISTDFNSNMHTNNSTMAGRSYSGVFEGISGQRWTYGKEGIGDSFIFGYQTSAQTSYSGGGYSSIVYIDTAGNITGSSFSLSTNTGGQNLLLDDGTTVTTSSIAAGGGLANIVEDTTPQLGGALDTNGFAIGTSVTDNHVITGSLTLRVSGSTVFDILGSQGQLFSITDDLTGDIFGVGDISGDSILNVNSAGVVSINDTLEITGSLIISGGIGENVLLDDGTLLATSSLGGGGSGDVVLDNTSANDGYLLLNRNTGTSDSVLYVNNYGTGELARFYAGASLGSTTATDIITFTNDASIEASGNLRVGSAFTNSHVISGSVIIEASGSSVFEIQGSQGQLFSITDDLTGDIFAVGDISGDPIFNVNANGTVTISDRLDVTGSIHATGEVEAFAASDERLKLNMTPIEEPLDKIMQIGGYEYDWNESIQTDKKGHDVGVSAQEIQKVLPDLVRTNHNGYLAVNYDKLPALLIEANKALIEEVDALKEKNSKLEARLTRLETILKDRL